MNWSAKLKMVIPFYGWRDKGNRYNKLNWIKKKYILGNSKKFEVLLCLPRVDAWNANGPISSFENIDVLDAALFIDSRELLRLARYARPP